MAKKVINMARTGPWAQRWAIRISLVIIVAAGLLFVRNVLAVHDTGAFELDGNATTETTNDWDQVYADSLTTPHGNSAGAVAISFAADKTGAGIESLQATIFTGGGSKDPQDISNWAWKDDAGGLPDKDNLLHAFAARYSLPGTEVGGSCPNGTGDLNLDGNITPPEVPFDASVNCEVLFFGSDRYDNSGDAQQGFWFVQNEVSLGDQPKGGGTTFNGVHAVGDLLVISNFSNGGQVSTITIYSWDPACLATNKPTSDCADANLRRLATSAAANCATATAGDAFCGIVNPVIEPNPPGTTFSPWPFLDKSGNSGFLNGEFFEGGVNLSLLGLADECFSTLISETRSSTSTTAVLKDFVLGPFANCRASLSTTPSVGAGGAVSPGTPVTDIATVLGAGLPNPPTPTGNVTFYLCGPSQLTPVNTGICASGSGTTIGFAALADSSPPTGEAQATSAAVNTVASPLPPGRYCFRATWPGDTNYPTPLEHSGVGDGECFIVRDTTSIVSQQSWVPNDSATVTAAGGTALSGTLTFQLYTGDNCGATSGAAVANQFYSHTLTNAASPATRTTSNSTAITSPGGVFSWLVNFNSTNSNVLSSSKCEKSTLTIVDQ